MSLEFARLLSAGMSHFTNTLGVKKGVVNVTPPDVCFGPDKAILQQKEKIKRKTPVNRAACITAHAPHDAINQMSKTLS